MPLRDRLSGRTINSHLVKQLGVRRALNVEMFVMLWGLYVASEGHEPGGVEDLADAIARDRATVYRWQADFRLAFPEWSTPRDLLDYAQFRKKTPNARQIGALAWPP